MDMDAVGIAARGKFVNTAQRAALTLAPPRGRVTLACRPMPSKPYSIWDRVTLAQTMRAEGRVLANEAKLSGWNSRRRRLSPFSFAPFRSQRVRWASLLGTTFIVVYLFLTVQIFMSDPRDYRMGFLTILCFAVFGWWAWHYENPLILPTRRRRVRAYERARRALRQPDTTPSAGIAPSTLAADYAARCAPWNSGGWGGSPPKSFVGPQNMFITLDRRALLANYSGFLVMFGGQLLSRLPGNWPMPVPAMFIGIVAGFTGIWYSHRRYGVVCRGLGASLQSRSCPDCGYPLGDIPPGIDPSLLGGVNAGPARCHECGTPWPLVPPPVAG